jgi:hypothetical protein
MRWPGLIEAYDEFSPASIQSSLVNVKELPNDGLAVMKHIKGVVNR